MVAGHRGHWFKCTRALNKVHTWLRAYFAIYYCTTHKKMYTNVTKQHTEMKYKLHIYMQARERAVVGSTRLVVLFLFPDKGDVGICQIGGIGHRHLPFAIGEMAKPPHSPMANAKRRGHHWRRRGSTGQTRVEPRGRPGSGRAKRCRDRVSRCPPSRPSSIFSQKCKSCL